MSLSSRLLATVLNLLVFLANTFASAIQRRPRLSATLFGTFSLLLLLRIEWAYFRPKLIPPRPLTNAWDDSALELRLADAEDRYQAVLRRREDLVHRVGPKPEEVIAFPRDLKLYTLWDFFPPAFQCPHQIDRVGNPGVGGKWVCGLDRLVDKQDCVVYSFGSSWDSSYEAEILRRTKHCKIYGHHFDSKKFGPEVRTIDRLNWRTQFRKYGLHQRDEPPIHRTLTSIMFENGHDFIDLVKIDLEGHEFAALSTLLEAYQKIPLPIGQLQIEIHASEIPFGNLLRWWELLEGAGLRPFYTEPNLVYVHINAGKYPSIAEYSFLNIRNQNAFTRNNYSRGKAKLYPDEPYLQGKKKYHY